MRLSIGRRAVKLLASALLLAGGCTEPSMGRDARAAAMDDLKVDRDLPYAPGERHSLDIYALNKPGPPRPVAIYIYGGAWAAGAKDEYDWVGAALARRGFLAVVPDYRIYPKARWPMFVEDNAAAVRWVKDNAARYGGDASSIVLIGHSSGAYNAFSLAVDHRWLGAVGLDPATDLKAVVGLSGPYRMWPPDPGRETEIFGSGPAYSEPADHIDGRSPPLLLLVGAHDRVAGPELTTEMADLVRKKGGEAKAILYPGTSHSDTQDAVGGKTGAPRDKILDDIMAFLAAHGVTPAP